MQFGFGTGVLTGVRTDSSGWPSPVNFGAFQGVQIEFGGDTKMLYATGQYPLDTARGKVKISGKTKVANINGRMYNELFFGQTLATGSTKFKWNELATLGTGAASYTVALVSTPLTDQGVFYGRQQFVQVSSSPGTAEYTFVASTGVYTFGTVSAGLALNFNYTWTAASGYNISSGNPLMGTTPRFKVTLFDQMAHDTKQTVLVLYACVSNRLTFPTTIDDYVIQDLDFDAFESDSGQVFDWSMNEA
jgi:hypothetical protein